MSLTGLAATTRARRLLELASALACGAALASPAHAASSFNFKMVRTQGLPKECAEHATASVHVDTTPGFAEKLVITVKGFRPGTPLVLFAIQKPNAPFGIGWYEGDVAIGAKGSVTETFVSRFNIETFATAIGQAQAADSRAKRNGLSEADLDVLAKLLEQRLEQGEEAEALPRRQVVAEHDLLQLGVARRV